MIMDIAMDMCFLNEINNIEPFPIIFDEININNMENIFKECDENIIKEQYRKDKVKKYLIKRRNRKFKSHIKYKVRQDATNLRLRINGRFA